jgi:hypothetical protein
MIQRQEIFLCPLRDILSHSVLLSMTTKAMNSSAQFAHRALSDGMVDSICLRCYRTIVTTICESDREVKEAGHVCDAMDLAILVCQEHPIDQVRRPRKYIRSRELMGGA